ncbi:short-subunit dehydrogenase [Paenibacillus shirakamiensis]|uniref:Short-subunit dehydrogenase n=1 Tax=Paenibacillus shirakamiensis TaxID=1265935 RepID=A0ABS4JFW8_9BACL|nr:SDR family oxidoreductase [Paenibacillus shirakamiensis]MBP2000597.1 short-subunit dehydrogenase [Paenibacillus shirakamiensis]
MFGSKKTIFITGAGSGLGKGTALGLAHKGHQVIASVETISQVTSLREEAKAQGLDMEVIKLDVNNPLDRSQLEKYDFDVYVANAGIGEGGPLAEIPVENVRRIFDTNVFSSLEMAQIVARKFVAKKKGKIIFVSSIAGLSVTPYLGAYCASKHAVEAMAQALKGELAEFGVQVATINPGPYKTGFNDMMFEEKEKWYDESTNFTKRSDIAKSELMLASQFDPQDMIDKMVEVIEAKHHPFRTVHPAPSEAQVKAYEAKVWEETI